jgi:hypothetical protein
MTRLRAVMASSDWSERKHYGMIPERSNSPEGIPMDQAKAVINLNEGIIQLEGPVEFVQRYLEKYAPAVKAAPVAKVEAVAPAKQAKPRAKRRGGQRSCTRAIRAEIKAGFFDEPRSGRAVGDRLAEKGVTCSVGMLRTSLKKAVAEQRLVVAGRGRGVSYSRKTASSEVTPEA